MNWNWLISRFLTICPPLLILAYLLTGLYSFQTATDKGNDFWLYWVASSMAAGGDPASVYDFSQLQAALQKIVGERAPIYEFLYPPTFLLIILPFSLLPFWPAVSIWLFLTLAGYLQVLRRIAPHRLMVWWSLAFPGTLQNMAYGQNGFLSAALLGGGLLLLERFPFTAGLLFGLLCYKPHLAALVPVALIAGRHWRALVATLVTFGFMALLSGLVLGWGTWEAFWRNAPLAFKVLEVGKPDWSKMTTVFSAALLAGGSLGVALILQGLVMLGALATVAWVWFRGASLAIRASTLVLGVLLFTPYAFEYDLALLALPLAWLGWEGYMKGWLPGEPAAILVGWLTPLFCAFLAKDLNFQIVPALLIILLFLVLRRHYRSPGMMGAEQGVKRPLAGGGG